MLIAGSRLGPYEILTPLGAGGMGEVYKARDTRLDRTVAIKVLPADVAGDPELRERFDREARAVGDRRLLAEQAETSRPKRLLVRFAGAYTLEWSSKPAQSHGTGAC